MRMREQRGLDVVPNPPDCVSDSNGDSDDRGSVIPTSSPHSSGSLPVVVVTVCVVTVSQVMNRMYYVIYIIIIL